MVVLEVAVVLDLVPQGEADLVQEKEKVHDPQNIVLDGVGVIRIILKFINYNFITNILTEMIHYEMNY